jgi:superfamily I DNA/RNA helicase
MADVDAGGFDGASQAERNLFYVGASRARRRLTMSFRDRPSAFLGVFAPASHADEVMGDSAS